MRKVSPRRFSKTAASVSADVTDEFLGALSREYAKAFRAAARDCARLFTKYATDLDSITADANTPPEGEPAKPPKFLAPDPDEVIPGEEMAAAVIARTSKTRAKAAAKTTEGILDTLGLSFDVGGVFSERLLATGGARAVDFGASVRDAVVRAIERGINEGLSVPHTADLIRTEIVAMSDTTATMLARTDLIGLTNGGSVEAARQVYPENNVMKVWLATGDDRTRESHAEADGQTVPLDQPFEVGGDSMDYPGDPNGSDEEVINCRCTVIYEEVAKVADVPAAVPPAITAAAVDHSCGSMICVYPDLVEAAAIARAGGQAAEDLHVTLAFLPSGVDDDLLEPLLRSLEQLARTHSPLEGLVSGIGRFQEGPDGVPVLALPSAVGLERLRVDVADALDAHGIEVASNYGWIPHMTLGYGDVANPEGAVGRPLSFANVTLSRGADRYDVPLGESTAAPVIEEENMQLSTSTKREGRFASSDGPDGRSWEATLLVENEPTEDGRMMAPGSIRWRDLPLSLMAMRETGPGGHEGAVLTGRIDAIRREESLILGAGVFNSDEFSEGVADDVENQSLRGVSVDLAIIDYEIRDPETGAVLSEDEQIEYWIEGKATLFVVLEGVIGMATVCPFQAIERATIEVTAGADGFEPGTISSRIYDQGALTMKIWTPFGLSGVTASAAGAAPLNPPREWFDDPKFDRLTPLTVTDDGRVFGHVASWDSCHLGNPAGPNICTRPEPSMTNYSLFNLGEIVCEDGSTVAVGTLTLDAGHAPPRRDPRQVRSHYDNTGYGVADVRAGDDLFGPWVAGAVRPELPVEKLRVLRSSKISGDWRRVNGNLELVAALCVNVPGYPIPRTEVVASLENGEWELQSVTAAGIVVDEGGPGQGVDVLIAIEAAEALDGIDGIAAYALED